MCRGFCFYLGCWGGGRDADINKLFYRQVILGTNTQRGCGDSLFSNMY